MRPLLASAPFALAFLLAACGGSQEVLLTPQERATYASTNVVALAPLNVTAQERPQNLLTAAPYFERVLTQRLERSGFRVIEPEVGRAEYDTLALNAQNKYDVETGEPNPAVMEGLKTAFAQRMAARHGADAVLFPDVLLVRAEIDGATAKWDGVQEAVSQGLIDRTGQSESFRAGSLAALSLGAEVVLPSGERLHTGRGGIEFVEPLRRRQAVPVQYRGQVTKEGLLQEPTRAERAVLLALDRFLEKKAAAGTAGR